MAIPQQVDMINKIYNFWGIKDERKTRKALEQAQKSVEVVQNVPQKSVDTKIHRRNHSASPTEKKPQVYLEAT